MKSSEVVESKKDYLEKNVDAKEKDRRKSLRKEAKEFVPQQVSDEAPRDTVGQRNTSSPEDKFNGAGNFKNRRRKNNKKKKATSQTFASDCASPARDTLNPDTNENGCRDVKPRPKKWNKRQNEKVESSERKITPPKPKKDDDNNIIVTKNKKDTFANKNISSKKCPQHRNKSKIAPMSSPSASSLIETATATATTTANPVEQKKKKNNRKPRRRKPKQKFSWRTNIPDGSLDPITLDPLDELSYPPFPLVIEPPYVPVDTFPPPHDFQAALHLFDGRTLAYYLISQLQFIDPLNRRDLTRPELVCLDNYLKKHNLGEARVVEAYDFKGVSISSAGSEAQTARGRTRMLQEEAASILEALFQGHGSTTNSNNPTDASFRNEFESQYLAHERRSMNTQQTPQNSRSNNTQQRQTNSNTVTISEHGVVTHQDDDNEAGFLIIDDDENPGLRGGVYANNASSTNDNNVNGRFASTSARIQQQGNNLFPSLQAATTGEPPASVARKKKQGVSRSLKVISKTITKTDPAQLAKEKKAREEMQRRAMLSQQTILDYESPHSIMETTANNTSSQAVPPPAHCISKQLERNRNLALALDVKPSTSRSVVNGINCGWARPVNHTLDEFGSELNSVIYPQSLVNLGRDKMKDLLKVERKWKNFLADDTASSLSLNPMLRDMRVFVHEYSDFWRLETESYDREPKRYIVCRKLQETCAPTPLLSHACRNIKYVAAAAPDNTCDSPPTEIQPGLKPREFLSTAERAPLPLLPRGSHGVTSGTTKEVEAVAEANDEIVGDGSRFQALSRTDRPKLQLEPRTIPPELPPFQSKNSFTSNLEEKRRLQEAKQRAERKKKESILAAAFASDDESDWSEAEALYESSDNE